LHNEWYDHVYFVIGIVGRFAYVQNKQSIISCFKNCRSNQNGS